MKPEMIRLLALLFLSLLFLSSFVAAEEEEENLHIKGYYKGFLTGSEPASLEGVPPSEKQPSQGAAINKLRVDLFWQAAESLSLELAYEIKVGVKDTAVPLEEISTSRSASSSYRFNDFDAQLYPDKDDPQGSFYVLHNLDRAVVTWNADLIDFYFGRQPIAFGSGKLVNPTDVFFSFTYDALDKEERTGVDAIRVKLPVGEMSELDAGYVAGDEFREENSGAFLRGKFDLWQNDVSLLAIKYRHHYLAGLDIAGSISGAGYWIEAAHSYVNALEKERNEEDDFSRLSTGLDYNLTDGLYGWIEFHYNGAGKKEPEAYPQTMENIGYVEAGGYLLGRQYLAVGAVYQITPLWTFDGRVLGNLNDHSGYLATSLQHNFKEDVFVDVGLFIRSGKRAKVSYAPLTGQPIIEPQSEFGLYANRFYTSVRLYF